MKRLKNLLLLIPTLLLFGAINAQTTANVDFDMSYQYFSCDSFAEVSLTNLTTSNPSNTQLFYEWYVNPDMNGNGGPYTSEDLTLFLEGGITYTISLYAFSDPNYQNFIDSTTNYEYIPPSQGSLQPEFTYNYISSTCNGDSIQFWDGTQGGNVIEWVWSVDGQFMSSEQNPVLNLTAGTHTVSLSVMDANGCSSSVAYTVSAQGQGNGIDVYYTYNILNNSCTASEVEFFSTVFGGQGPYTYDWSFGSTDENPVAQLPPFSEWITLYVTDANGCTGVYEDIVIDSTGSFSIYAEVSNNTCNDICANTIEVETFGGASPYTYSLDQGVTFQTSSTFTNVCPGIYEIMTQDANGCDAIYTVIVDSTASMYVQFYVYTPSCDGQGQDSTDLSFIEAYTIGGASPHTYQWSNGETGGFIQDLVAGDYTVIVTDANGCTVTETINIPESEQCFTISGNVYLDYNGDCIVDSGDIGLSSYWVDLVDANGTFYWLYDYTDGNGYYEITVPAGEYFFDLSTWNNINYDQNCPADGFSISVDASNPNGVVDFFMTPPAPVQDLSISMYNITTPTPGFPLWSSVYYCNDGTIPMSGNVTVEHDPNLIWVNQGTTASGQSIYTSPSPENYDAPSNTLTFNFSSLMPGQCNYIGIDYETSSTVGLLPGDAIINQATVNPVVGDVTPNNNFTYVADSVTSSWDPNDKAVYPNGDITVDDKDHSYHIRFQNEGNANAHVVVVRDDLDDNLDLQSLRNVSASHNFIMTIENDDELVFTFNNIQLPPKDVDEVGSQGHINFTISQEPNLPVGTVIENTAAIYFDFNEPVITNTVSNEIVEKTVGINEQEIANAISLYPNPSNGTFHISTEMMIENIKVMDVIGNVILVKENMQENEAIFNLAASAEGVYFVQIETKEGTAVKRVVLQK